MRTHIAESGLDPGDVLPTEQALTEIFGVSRSTAREALARLQRAGLVERRRARGTRVAYRPFVEHFAWLDSYVLHEIAQGRTVRSEPLTVVRLAVAPRAVAATLALAPDERVHVVRRVVWVAVEPHHLTAGEPERLRRRAGDAALRRTRLVRTSDERPPLFERAVFVNGLRLTLPTQSSPRYSTPGGPA